MPTVEEITSFIDDGPPPGQSPWVVAPESSAIAVVDSDGSWPDAFADIADRISRALGPRALDVLHIGSTSVPGLPAKPVIDIDLIVADPARENDWLPALIRVGFILTVREPWWYEHRLVKCSAPDANVHVFGPDAPEPWKHRIFRDHLRRDERDREVYAAMKLTASQNANERGETVMEYNHRKQAVIRQIYGRAFRQAGLSE
ncbi:hypothetical protein A5784_04320 [Mycobacterium sp. 852013-50091_SCH5140682]|uniref:GrpB family protein n=1 Tax=Mycobacterium sp. 852013-50091_SCH5140682 TaxID=1834109 RepID=UPI0007EB54B5|nr:GrpB family protein [Mycobacterium sp. 852013-50091_SCH5140682]OBC12041.1 hypothetical protein A5784_04320 [Mycobacterium sp. 852013-50091_SCH5140682]